MNDLPANGSDPLFQPYRLGDLTLRNRIVMAPMTRCFSPGGVPGADVAAYYARRARHGVGLIVTEGVGIDHPASIGEGGVGETDLPVLYGDAAIAGWRNVVDAVHAEGGLIMPQLWHMGVIRLEGTGPFPDAPSCRPSGLWGAPNRPHSMQPGYTDRVRPLTKPMTDSDIADVISAYARSAATAIDIGFDGIAIHGAHGYLIDTFFWAATNQREDRYGGSIAARARFGAEVVRAIRAAIGDKSIVFRYSQWKQQDYEAKLADTPAELEELLGPLSDAGVDVFEASTRRFETPAFAGSDLGLAGWTRKITGKPAMCVGGIGLDKDLISSFQESTVACDNLATVRAALVREEFDLVAVGRSLLMDPAWGHKVREGAPFVPFDPEMYGRLN